MRYVLVIAFALAIFPASVSASKGPSSFSLGSSLIIASSTLSNSYAAGASVVVTGPVSGDLSVTGGSIVAASSVSGDELLVGGSVNSRAHVGGDLRILGGSVRVEDSVAGDMVAFGYSVRNTGRVSGNIFIGAINAELANGASGPVKVYGNDVSLSGVFSDDVFVVASGRLTLVASTTIAGKLFYQTPEVSAIPDSVVVADGIEYKKSSYLPDIGTSRILGLASIGFFLFVRVLGALILAGLLAGLFPRLAEILIESAFTKAPRNILLTMLLGFAILVATPVLFILLMLTFVGFGLALLILLSYALLVLIAVTYSGILIGGVWSRRFRHRDTILWHDGVLGMLLLSLIALAPSVGLLVVFLLTIFSAGALLQQFFNFAFSHDEQTIEMV